jgi:ferredoxin-thioredoxin reductase catalytic chain
MIEDTVTDEEVEAAYTRIKCDAESVGYYLNPDAPFTRQIIQGLLINQKRMGYQACPCRFASGKREEDLDIICPCDYRDTDLEQYDTCY